MPSTGLSKQVLSPQSKFLLVAAAALGVALAVIAAFWLLVPRGPLSGYTSHNFGVVALTGQPVFLEHTFRLRNHTSQAIEVRQAMPDCGCVKLDFTPTTVAPGDEFILPLEMRVGNKTRRVQIKLDLGDAGSQNLWLKATGKYQTAATLGSAPSPVTAAMESPAE